ncbi:glioma pathogenesis-related protein 1-like [Saccostrea cucullata]|uniref:glioma pathogenesis-related protein 1-like n=1 Tax=Saccostrea cuccullata TaxID=36930 RepID=UPI002ED1562E
MRCFLWIFLALTVEICQCKLPLVVTWVNDTGSSHSPRNMHHRSSLAGNAHQINRHQTVPINWSSRRSLSRASENVPVLFNRQNIYPSNRNRVKSSTGLNVNSDRSFSGQWGSQKKIVHREDTREKPYSSSTASRLSEAQKRQIVDLHNKIRRSVTPSAANMKKMSWDTTLEQMAQKYAETCSGTHNADRHKRKWANFRNIGENIHHTWDWVAEYEDGVLVQKTLPLNISKVLHRWWGEKNKYDYRNPYGCPKGCGHYIQMVKDVSFAIGCGTSLCETVKGRNYKNAHIFVCNYGDGYNESMEPYYEGTPCSDCPTGHPVCNQGLCDVP